MGRLPRLLFPPATVRRISSWGYTAARLAMLALSIGTILWFGSVIRAVDRGVPDRLALGEVSFSVAPGETRVIGRRELGQVPGVSAAEPSHIAFESAADGHLYLRNVAAYRRLDVTLEDGGRSVYSDRSEIPPPEAGRLDLVVGTQTVTLSREAQGGLRVEVPTDHGIRTDRIDDIGVVADQASRDWCGAQDLIQRFTAGPLRDLSRWVSDTLARWRWTSTVRQLAILGGPASCRNGAGTQVIAMPLANPETEFGITRLDDRGVVRLYVHLLRGAPDTPISFRTRDSGGDVVHLRNNRQLDWPLTRAGPGMTRIADGFTAGKTRYSLTVAGAPGGAWTVGISPVARVTYFQSGDCADRAGTWLASPAPEEDIAKTMRCPGPGRADNQDISVSMAAVGAPIQRMYLFGRAGKAVAENPTDGGAYGASALSGEELALYCVLVAAGCGLALVGLLAQLGRRSINRGLRASVLAFVPGLSSILLWVLLTDNWGAAFAAEGLFHANLLMFALCAVATALDDEGGLSGQFFFWVTLVLVLVGAATLFTLGAEGENSDWERHFIKHKAFALDILPLYWTAFCLMPVIGIRNFIGSAVMERLRWHSPFILVAILLAFFLLLWLVAGTQQGILGFQPIEAGKTAVFVGLAVILAMWTLRARLITGSTTPSTIARLAIAGLFITGFVSSLIVVPVLKHDYSPVIVIGLSLTGTVVMGMLPSILRIIHERRQDQAELLALPVRFISRRLARLSNRALLSPLLALLAAGVIGLVALDVHERKLVPEGWSYFDPPARQVEVAQNAFGEGRRTTHERLLIWAQMRYPDPATAHTSPLPITERELAFQGIRSRVAIAHARCGVSPAFAGLLAPLLHGDPALDADVLAFLSICSPASVLPRVPPSPDCGVQDLKQPVVPHCIPVIESDFIGTYLFARHGVGAGLLVMLFQFLFVVTGMSIFVALKRGGSREPVVTGANETMSILVLGATLLFLVQWLMSWGNAFVLLPIMGQPMTWISAATSHHVFMAVPAVLAILIGNRIARTQPETVPFGHHP